MLELWKTHHDFPKNGGKLGGKCEKPLIFKGFSKNWSVKVIGFGREMSDKKITKSYTALTFWTAEKIYGEVGNKG